MANIGGKTIGTVQVNTAVKNDIGEAEKTWAKAFSHAGWLDLQSGDSKYSTHKAKIEESTHVFLCDYHSGIYALTIPDSKTKAVPDVRMIIKGMVYDVLLIDNPMEMDEQLEIYLRKVGAWDGC
jgi:hypothetical protein